MGARQPWHLSVLWLAQQFEMRELGTDTSAGAIGERAPTPNVSAANNSRAGGIIGNSLSLVGIFQRTFSVCNLIDSVASTSSKIL